MGGISGDTVTLSPLIHGYNSSQPKASFLPPLPHSFHALHGSKEGGGDTQPASVEALSTQ